MHQIASTSPESGLGHPYRRRTDRIDGTGRAALHAHVIADIDTPAPRSGVRIAAARAYAASAARKVRRMPPGYGRAFEV